MSYEEISLKGFVDEIKGVSSGSHARKFCFVLGAGASKTSGIKSGQELVDAWDKELLERNKEKHSEWKKSLGINDTNKYSFYSQYYERRFRREPVDGYNYLEKLMEHAKPSIGYVMLSHLLTETKHDVVITTNFDHLIEDAVNYYTQKIPLIVGHETLTHYISTQINRPKVIKIHRDLLYDPKNRTDELETLHENWKLALNAIFSEYYPVFIGYAGNDNSLMNFLLENKDMYSANKWKFPYWMLYKTDKLNEKILELLESSEGYLIKHSGFDEVMYLLGAAFDYKLPQKETFLSDAEKRFQMLSDAIDAFSEQSTDTNAATQDDSDSSDSSTEITQAIQQITGQTELQSLYRKAVTLHNAGEYEEALIIKRQLLEREPNNARYLNSMGMTLHAMKCYNEAVKEKQRAVELEPNNAGYHGSLGVTLHEMEHYNEAMEEKQRAVELEPNNARYHDSLGVTMLAMKHYNEALVEMQRAIELESNNARYHDNLSNALHALKYYDKALEESRKAVALEPNNAKYHNSMGVTLHMMEQYDEAVKEKQRAVELEPNNAGYHDNLGVTLHEMEHYNEAMEEKQRAVELEPNNARYHDNLSNTFHAMEDYDKALEEARRAVELEPNNARYRDSLGVTMLAMELYNEAMEEMQRAVELEPNNARYHDNLSITLHELKYYDRALEEARRAVELDPSNTEYIGHMNHILQQIEKQNRPE